MIVIQLEVDEKLIQEIGVKSIKDFMESQLSLLKLRYLGDKVTEAILESGADHNKEVEEARKEAWEEYKEKHLKDIL